MSEYGAEDDRRAEIRRKIALVSVALLGLLFLYWMFFRNWSEEGALEEFVEALRAKNYQKAYAMWGCTGEKPCEGYSYPRFLEDWGPEGKYKAASQATISRSGHTGSAARRFLLKFKPPDDCDENIIRVLHIDGNDLTLIVNRADNVIGFSPWPVCNPRLKF
jgi:hypothetical protein